MRIETYTELVRRTEATDDGPRVFFEPVVRQRLVPEAFEDGVEPTVTDDVTPAVDEDALDDAPHAVFLPFVSHDVADDAVDAADAPAAPLRANAIFLPLVQRGVANDGHFIGAGGALHPPSTDPATIAPITPSAGGAAPTGQLAYWVNGILRSAASSASAAQALADETGDDIIGIYNATEGPLIDIAEAFADQNHTGDNAATTTLVALMRDAIDADQDIKLYGASQGGAIIDHAAQILYDDYYLTALAEGQSEADARAHAEQQMSHVTVVTYGSFGSDFDMPVDGVRHYVNTNDPVPTDHGVDRPGNPSPEDNVTVLRSTWGPAGLDIFDPRVPEVHLAENYFLNTDPNDTP